MEEDQDDLEKIVQLAEELITVIDNEKIEKKLLDDCIKEWQKILEIRDIQKAYTKNILQEIIDMGSIEETNYKKIEAVCEERNAEGRGLEQMVSQRKEEQATIQTMCTRLQENLVTCQQEVQRLEIEKQENDKQKKISIPKARHDITMYKLITNLHWELEPPPNEIRGYVCGNTEVKPFSFNVAQMSKYDIGNALWDQIGEDCND